MSERIPDWRSPAFWTWAITACNAAPKPLKRWFPGHEWNARKAWARDNLGITFPVLSRAYDVEYADTPPEGWPASTGHTSHVPSTPQAPQTYKETTERLGDGSWKSDKLLEMSEQQSKDEAYLLKAHGFDPDLWEIVTAKHAAWQGLTKGEDGEANVTTMYASRITVKPTAGRWTLDDLLAAFRDTCAPVHIESPTHGEMLLELGYTDAHFGNSTIETYRGTIARSVEIIRSKPWKRIVIWTGSDFFHCDNFKNTTAHGTLQSSVWWPDAFADGLEFIGCIIEEALAHGCEVHVVYVPGNHDESMSWMFANLLQQRYPQAVHDTEIAERKIHVFGECAIGLTHGDEKTRKDLDRIFAAEFRAFSAALHKEVHMGHLHHETVKDNYGVTSRSLPTKARTDKWHREEGFVGARKRFQVFEWDASDGVTDIHYV